MKVGDRVVTVVEIDPYFKKGDRAVLEGEDSDGDWWADFTGNQEHWKKGHWCIGKAGVDFIKEKLDE